MGLLLGIGGNLGDLLFIFFRTSDVLFPFGDDVLGFLSDLVAHVGMLLDFIDKQTNLCFLYGINMAINVYLVRTTFKISAVAFQEASRSN